MGGGVFIRDLSLTPVVDEAEAAALVLQGLRHRQQAVDGSSSAAGSSGSSAAGRSGGSSSVGGSSYVSSCSHAVFILQVSSNRQVIFSR